ncbi:hypothetical protein FrCorBMG51_09815 [Protofrankia coriariae]|uniref:Uncharacterized protein n=1 Tax=Protofrankia coriariae TaxID=1562887 RepID=A0ABR5F4K5_9ACTN|nr:hypothetical protein FrCorBMG51_09815 [Protofrankia coriariae]
MRDPQVWAAPPLRTAWAAAKPLFPVVEPLRGDELDGAVASGGIVEFGGETRVAETRQARDTAAGGGGVRMRAGSVDFRSISPTAVGVGRGG